MKCRDYQCRKGAIDKKMPVWIKTSCVSSTVVYPCNICGRLHWENGSPVRNRSGHRGFLKNGKVFNLPKNGKGYFL